MTGNRIKFDLLIHDLKVPLAVVETGITSLLKSTEKFGPLTPMQQKVLKRVLRNARVTQRLVNDALEIGKAENGIIRPTKFKLSSLLEEFLIESFDLADSDISDEIKACCTDFLSIQAALKEKEILLNVETSQWYEEICMDEAKIKQILRNLLNNALKYRKKQIDITVGIYENKLHIAVKDDGEGIPYAYHQKIFENYFQMEPHVECPVRGHGIGLAGVMALVNDMNGKLTLESEKGKGAEFSVIIPLLSI